MNLRNSSSICAIPDDPDKVRSALAAASSVKDEARRPRTDGLDGLLIAASLTRRGTISTVGGLNERDLAAVGHEFLAKARQPYHGRDPTAHGLPGGAACALDVPSPRGTVSGNDDEHGPKGHDCQRRIG